MIFLDQMNLFRDREVGESLVRARCTLRRYDQRVMPANSTVQTWLRQAASGDVLAVQKLLVLHHPALCRIAARKLPDALRGKIEPEDLLQEVYADVVRRLPEFDSDRPAQFLRWLLRILESKVIDARRFFRAAMRDVRREVSARQSASNFGLLAGRAARDSLTPSRIVRRREQEAMLLAAMAGLSEDYRRVLELRYARDLPLEVVAEIMKRSPGAVQMLCARALRRLRESLRKLSRTDN